MKLLQKRILFFINKVQRFTIIFYSLGENKYRNPSFYHFHQFFERTFLQKIELHNLN